MLSGVIVILLLLQVSKKSLIFGAFTFPKNAMGNGNERSSADSLFRKGHA